MRIKKLKCDECGRPPAPQIGYALGKCTCESPRFREVEVEACPICLNELHSIITRRVGDYGLCLNCGDILNPLVAEIANSIISRAQLWIEGTKGDPPAEQMRVFVEHEITDRFSTTLNDPDLLLSIIGPIKGPRRA